MGRIVGLGFFQRQSAENQGHFASQPEHARVRFSGSDLNRTLAHIIHGWQLARRASEWYAPRSLACASC